jgi:hypothetical protein
VRSPRSLLALGTSLVLTTGALIGFPSSPAAAAARTLTVTGTQALPDLVQNPRVEGRDNGQSAYYHGRSVWIFDDTIEKNPWDFKSNTGATTTDLNASDGITLLSDNPFTLSQGDPEEILPYTAAEKAFTAAHAAPCAAGDDYCGTQIAMWPGPVVADPARHRILFTYGKLCRGAPDGTPCASGFVGTPIGTGFAQLDMLTHKVSRITVQNPDPSIWSPEGTDDTMLWPPDRVFGGGSMTIKDGLLYAWGNCTAQTNICGVARVPAGQLQNRLAWRFYTGTDQHGRPVWGTDPAGAVSVGMVTGAAGGTVQYLPAIHGYLDTYMDGISSVAKYQTAPTPWGPWSAAKAMFTGIPTTNLWDYAMFAHPEYATNGGLTQYLTYYHPDSEQQKLVRVDFSLS